MYEFIGHIECFEPNALLYGPHIPLPEDIYLQMKTIAPDKRVKCIFNHSLTHYAAMLPKKDAYHYIMLNKDILKKLKLQIGDTINVSIDKQDLKYGIPISEEMQEVLNSDWEGDAYFHKLTAGTQRSLIHVINKYKSPQLRIDRTIILLRHLVLRQGHLDFKILQQNFREDI